MCFPLNKGLPNTMEWVQLTKLGASHELSRKSGLQEMLSKQGIKDSTALGVYGCTLLPWFTVTIICSHVYLAHKTVRSRVRMNVVLICMHLHHIKYLCAHKERSAHRQALTKRFFENKLMPRTLT